MNRDTESQSTAILCTYHRFGFEQKTAASACVNGAGRHVLLATSIPRSGNLNKTPKHKTCIHDYEDRKTINLEFTTNFFTYLRSCYSLLL